MTREEAEIGIVAIGANVTEEASAGDLDRQVIVVSLIDPEIPAAVAISTHTLLIAITESESVKIDIRAAIDVEVEENIEEVTAIGIGTVVLPVVMAEETTTEDPDAIIGISSKIAGAEAVVDLVGVEGTTEVTEAMVASRLSNDKRVRHLHPRNENLRLI